MKEASKVLLLLLRHQVLPQTETSKVLIAKVSLQAHTQESFRGDEVTGP